MVRTWGRTTSRSKDMQYLESHARGLNFFSVFIKAGRLRHACIIGLKTEQDDIRNVKEETGVSMGEIRNCSAAASGVIARWEEVSMKELPVTVTMMLVITPSACLIRTSTSTDCGALLKPRVCAGPPAPAQNAAAVRAPCSHRSRQEAFTENLVQHFPTFGI